MDIFRIFRKSPILDDVFGKLIFLPIKPAFLSLHYGTLEFENKQISINIISSKKGPTLEQQLFYLRLIKEFPFLKSDQIVPIIKTKLIDYFNDLTINSFEKEFTLEHLNILKCNQQANNWNISLESKTLENSINIDFQNNKAIDCWIDGELSP
ncbi:MAG: hypothetical protein ACI9N1_001180 [Flavobacteriales bacterium]|jgi:hypothetical protein